MFIGDALDVSVFLVSGEDNVVRIVLTNPVFDEIQSHHELGYGFHGIAGFCNDMEHGLCRINDVEKSVDTVGIDVVQNIEPRTAPLFPGELVIADML